MLWADVIETIPSRSFQHVDFDTNSHKSINCLEGIVHLPGSRQKNKKTDARTRKSLWNIFAPLQEEKRERRALDGKFQCKTVAHEFSFWFMKAQHWMIFNAFEVLGKSFLVSVKSVEWAFF